MTQLAYFVEREFNVPIEAMWQAWTDADALESWYHPTDLAVVPGSVVSDPVPEGWWTVAVDVPAHGFVAYFYGRYRSVEPMRLLVHDLAYTQDVAVFEARDETQPAHRIEVEFKDRGGRTRVRFSQFGQMPTDQAAGAQAGMESYFDSLHDYLQPDQYRPMDQG